MIPDIREVDRPQVGRFYMVPSVTVTHQYIVDMLPQCPVYGPLHEDAEFINFPEHHWHIDYRFVPSPYWDYLTHYYHHFTTHQRYGSDEVSRVHARPISLKNTDGKPAELRKFKMRREMPPYVETHVIKWLAKLEDAYASHRLVGKCLTCPHRGVPLRNIPPNERGEVTCPAHGLTWDIATGKLVRRAPTAGQFVFPFATRGKAS